MGYDCRPEPGMTNLEWAEQLRIRMDTLSTKEADAFLASALNYACVYSERPADRFAREHLIPGHKVSAHPDLNRPGWMWVRCPECGAGLDVDQRDAVIFCLALNQPVECEIVTKPIRLTPEEPDGTDHRPAATD